MRRVPVLGAAFATGLCVVSPATAQTASPDAQIAPASQTAAGAGDVHLEEIVVTAQRRSENLQDTPLAVSAFGGSSLAQAGVSSVGKLAQVDPSLNIQASTGVYIPFLRGVGNGAGASVGNESSVPVYIDDVYYTRLSPAYLYVNSIERVEVLKGPQGTLFGRNSSGGAIQVFTRDPGKDPAVEGGLDYANYDTISGKFYASTPLTDRLGFNFSAAGSDQRNGWGKNEFTGKDAYREKYLTFRSKLAWEPTDSTKIKLVGFYAYQKGDIGVTQDRQSGTLGATPPSVVPSQPVLPRADVGRFYDTITSRTQFARERGYGGSIRIDQKTGLADVVSITAFRHSTGSFGNSDGDFTPVDFLDYNLNDRDRQFSQEFQIKSKPKSKITWIAGLYYLNARAGYIPATVSGIALDLTVAPGAVQDIYSRQTINSYSAFGQTTLPLGDQTNLTAGLRYTSDRVQGIGSQDVAIPAAGTFPIASADFNQKVKFDKLTYKAAIDHHFNSDVMGYASISRGYKSGTFNTLPLDRTAAKAEVVDAYEVGLKTEFFDRRLRLNGALFWNEIKNPQVLTVITTGNLSALGLTNAEKARVRGGEVSLDAAVADGLTFRAAATYLDGKYTSFRAAPFYTQLPGGGLSAPVAESAAGNRLPRVSKLRFDVGTNYSLHASPGTFTFDGNVAYTGRFYWDADNRTSQKPVALINASLNFTPASAQWLTFSAWGKNLGGAKYLIISFPVAGSAGQISGAAAPRTYGGSVAFKF